MHGNRAELKRVFFKTPQISGPKSPHHLNASSRQALARFIPMKTLAKNGLSTGVSLCIAILAAEVACALSLPSTAVKTGILGHDWNPFKTEAFAKWETISAGGRRYIDLIPSQKGVTDFCRDFQYEWQINNSRLKAGEPADKRQRTLRRPSVPWARTRRSVRSWCGG